MLRFSRHLRLKCRKSSFWEQKHCFWAFWRTEDLGLKIEDWGQHFHLLTYGWPHFHPLRPKKYSYIGKILKARLAGLHNLCHPALTHNSGVSTSEKIPDDVNIYWGSFHPHSTTTSLPKHWSVISATFNLIFFNFCTSQNVWLRNLTKAEFIDFATK